MSSLRAAFFDVGNTLSHVNYPVVARELRSLGVEAPVERVREAEIAARVRMDALLGGRQSMEGDSMFRRYCRMVLEAIGPEAAAQAEPLVAALEAYDRAGNLWDLAEPTVPAVVAKLRARGLRLGVISNSDGRVRDLLVRQGVASLFDVIVDSGSIKIEKPDPEIFFHAARALDVKPSESVHVGDIYSIDFVGCRRAGMHGILLDPLGAWTHVECPKARDLPHAAELILAL
jgi:HAD superfamily hydrolase (TIGR01509 family)